MPGLEISREHRLGLARAREIADVWVLQAEQDYAMECEIERGDAGDTVRFRRTGVSGELQVSADRFELTAQLGLLLGAFSQKIERAIAGNLDRLLGAADAGEAGAAAAPAAAEAKPAPAARRTASPRRRATARNGARQTDRTG